MKYTVRIKDNKDFTAAYKHGKYTFGKFVTVYYRKNNRKRTGLGITTGKKVGNAVTRNRCRRIIRAAFTICEDEFPKGFDYIITARPECGIAKSTDIVEFFRKKAIPAVKKLSDNKFTNSNKTI